MADEAAIINNPTSIPEAVSTGYQRQNVRAEAGTNGLDCSFVDATGVGEVTLYTGGPVDYNGVLYSLVSDAVLTLPGAGRYYIYLDGAESAATLTPTLTGTPSNFGSFDATKNGQYTATGKRILNWVIYWTGSGNPSVYKLNGDEIRDNSPILSRAVSTQSETLITSSTTWTAPASKYYDIIIQARGGDGGDAIVTTGGNAIASGGGSGAWGKARVFIQAGTVWTSTFNTGSGANTVFTDGSTTLYTENGIYGTNASSSTGVDDYDNNFGAGGTASSGMDLTVPGLNGGKLELITTDGTTFSVYSGRGADSAHGQGNYGRTTSGNGTNGEGYGSGGSGAKRLSSAGGGTSSGGSGAGALIRIIG